MCFLIDEMFPTHACRRLIEFGHDAIHVRDRGLEAHPDPEVASLAASEGWVLVTENVKDFAAQTELVIVCVLKSRLPSKGMAEHLARLLHEWSLANSSPYVGTHWPKIGT